MTREGDHDGKDETGMDMPVASHDGRDRAELVKPEAASRVTRPNYLEMHRENQRRIRDAQSAPAKERSRREARDRMRIHHGKTAETVRPYVKLDGFTPEEKKARKREQDRAARKRYNTKLGPVLSPGEAAELEAVLANLGPMTRKRMSADEKREKREKRRLEQIRYRAKKKARGEAEGIGVSTADGSLDY